MPNENTTSPTTTVESPLKKLTSRVVNAFTQQDQLDEIQYARTRMANALDENTEGRPWTKEAVAPRLDELFDDRIRLLKQTRTAKVVGYTMTAIGAVLVLPAIERITGFNEYISQAMIRFNEFINGPYPDIAGAPAENLNSLIVKLNELPNEVMVPLTLIGGAVLLAGLGMGRRLNKMRGEQEENYRIEDEYLQALISSGSKPLVGTRETTRLPETDLVGTQ